MKAHGGSQLKYETIQRPGSGLYFIALISIVLLAIYFYSKYRDKQYESDYDTTKGTVLSFIITGRC